MKPVGNLSYFFFKGYDYPGRPFMGIPSRSSIARRVIEDYCNWRVKMMMAFDIRDKPL